jgi:Heterokaryon incompatibility protein (HET)
MSASADRSWQQCPLGDAAERLFNKRPTQVGYLRAMENWSLVRSSLLSPSPSPNFRSSLSAAQFHSFRLLVEWWDGACQEQCLSVAARESINEAAKLDVSGSWATYASRQKARLAESAYHSHMFLLFEFEFLFEARLPLKGNEKGLHSVLHRQRERCSSLAALQRVGYAVVQNFADKSTRPSATEPQARQRDPPLADLLRNTIGVCIQPCPWLETCSTDEGMPYFLWDVQQRRTIVVEQLPGPPEYICVSHTWGRWRKKEEPSLQIPGVPWLVPQNSKFEVISLPTQIERAFKSGYVWFDLLCIPQDGSERALIEISRQADIFGNAASVVAWLNDVKSWSVMQDILTWFGLFYLHTNVAVKDGEYHVPDLPQPEEAIYKNMELYDWTSGDVAALPIIEGVEETQTIAAPMPWFTSLWTLQEVCLRPGLVLCTKDWEPLTIRCGILVTLDQLIALDNFVSRGEFAESVTNPENAKVG